MGLLDSLSDGINKGIGQTDRVLQMGRIKSTIGGLSRSRDELYLALGKHTYERNRRIQPEDENTGVLVGKVREIELQIAQLEAELEAVAAGQGSVGVRCASCGANNVIGAAFCVSCGSKIVTVEQVVCGHCQAPLAADARFCTRCGTVVEAAEQPAPPAPPVPQQAAPPVAEQPAPAPEPAAEPVADEPAAATGGAFCSNCGTLVEPGLHFCPNCGSAA